MFDYIRACVCARDMCACYTRANENKCITYIQCVNPELGLIKTITVMFYVPTQCSHENSLLIVNLDRR